MKFSYISFIDPDFYCCNVKGGLSLVVQFKLVYSANEKQNISCR